MRRRDFIGSLGLVATLGAGDALSSNDKFIDSEEMKIFPKERYEKRQYDLTKPEIVVWHTEAIKRDYPSAPDTRTAGFVEALANDKQIPYINGFLVQQQTIPGLDQGFFLEFSVGLSYLSLPRRLVGKHVQEQERYAFSELRSQHPVGAIKACSLQIDYRKLRLIENGKIYHPTKIAVEQLNANGGLKDGPPLLEDIKGVDIFPQKDGTGYYIDIRETLYFDLDHLPLNFKIEPPPLVISGVKVALPTFYFEPQNIYTHRWVNG